jgi:hypothetical protein
MAQVALEHLNPADQAAFVAALGGIFEHSPWVAEAALAARPFAQGLGDRAWSGAAPPHASYATLSSFGAMMRVRNDIRPSKAISIRSPGLR